MQIRQYVVASGVSPEKVEIVTRTVCVTLAALMNDPAFTNELVVVRRLQEENQYLRTQYTILKQTLASLGVQTARKRAPAKKKAPAAPRVKGGTAAQRRAFRQGYQGKT
jgi:hypothetical protein